MLHTVTIVFHCDRGGDGNFYEGTCSGCDLRAHAESSKDVNRLMGEAHLKAGINQLPPLDAVNHPSHYNTGKIEVIEFLEDQQLGFHLGNAVKYISRAGKKNPEKTIEDLEKAIWYLRRKIATLKGDAPRPNEMPQERAQ
jgi:hypothetical protein